MGFKPPKKLYKLVFENPEYAGLEIVAKSLSVEKFLAISNMAEQLQRNTDDKTSLDLADKVFASFVKSVEHWNIEDDNDKPLPVTLDGLKTLDFDFVVTLIQGWIGAMASVDTSLGKDLNSGNSALEQSLPMA